jgi:hypothetical protein
MFLDSLWNFISDDNTYGFVEIRTIDDCDTNTEDLTAKEAVYISVT